jgi:protein-tyrosine kinase
VVVAPLGTEGATTLAMLMAERAAADGKNTILADLNLKNRTLSQKLLLGDGTWSLPTSKTKWNALKPVAEHLQALPAPRHTATMQQLADQGGLPALFSALTSQAEVAVVDASPLSATNRGNIDAVTLATHAGKVILVAQQGKTHAEALKQAADQLLLSGAPVQGVVLNQQFAPSRRQLLGHLAEVLTWVFPPLGGWLRKQAQQAVLD